MKIKRINLAKIFYSNKTKEEIENEYCPQDIIKSMNPFECNSHLCHDCWNEEEEIEELIEIANKNETTTSLPKKFVKLIEKRFLNNINKSGE